MSSTKPPEHFALLRHVPLFSMLSEEDLVGLGPLVRRHSLPKNRAAVREGELTDALYIILSGRAKVQRSDSEGKEVILAVLGSGEYFGEMSLIDDMPHSASVITLEACEILTLAKDDFRACLARNANLAMAIMVGLVQRLRKADGKIESLALMDVYGRVARLLVEFSTEEDGVRVVRGKLPRQEVGKMVGASREMVSRVMRDLEIDGFVVPREDGSFQLNENRGPRL